MFSVKKEIVSYSQPISNKEDWCMIAYREMQAHGQVENIVALLCHNRHLQAQQAMDEADAIVRSSKTRFDKAAKRLAIKYPDDTIEGRQVRIFVEGCRYNMTANQNFRYDAIYEL